MELKLWIFDDDEQRRHDLEVILTFLGETPVAFSTREWQQAIESCTGGQLEDRPMAIFLGSSNSPGVNQELLGRIHEWDRGMPVMMVDGGQQDESVDSKLSQAIVSYLTFPPGLNKLLDDLHRARLFREQHSQNAGRKRQRDVLLFRSLVGTSRDIHKVRHMMAQVADSDVTVLVTGESGTGKEVVARNLHYNSHRRHKSFVPVNCGAIPPELLESELFGHEKGAFTGAISSRAGRFEMAKGGTLFLDEIGDMPLNMQVKILRVLQERCYERVGGNETITADVRIIAATHKNLDEMIEEGTFREDLYYRINVFPIEMPALRERAEDIPLLLNELIARMENEKRGSIRFNSAAIMSLCRYEWAGNVRELANLVERMAILHPYGVVGVKDLPKKFRHLDSEDEDELRESDPDQPDRSADTLAEASTQVLLPVNGLDLKEYITELECSLIQQALDDSAGVVARAAERLKIRRTTLVEKMRKYGLQRKETLSNI